MGVLWRVEEGRGVTRFNKHSVHVSSDVGLELHADYHIFKYTAYASQIMITSTHSAVIIVKYLYLEVRGIQNKPCTRYRYFTVHKVSHVMHWNVHFVQVRHFMLQ
jgi:hypothetical protein